MVCLSDIVADCTTFATHHLFADGSWIVATPQISERSDTVTREVRNQIENFSLIKGRPEGSQKWDEFAEVASSKIKDSYQRGNVEDEVKRGRARISRVKKVGDGCGHCPLPQRAHAYGFLSLVHRFVFQVSLSGAAQEAQDRRELREIGMAMAEFKGAATSPRRRCNPRRDLTLSLPGVPCSRAGVSRGGHEQV